MNYNNILNKIKTVLQDKYYGKIYLVGGFVRDEIMGNHTSDLDFMVIGSSSEVTDTLYNAGILDYSPVSYNQYNTSLVIIDGVKMEFTGARKEVYDDNSRKPQTETATLEEDVYRRDFTINTLAKDIFTDKIIDVTGRGKNDIKNKIIDTPLDPKITFYEDPLRIMRAVRFAGRFDFKLAERVKISIKENVDRLDIVSSERIRDELVKIVLNENAVFSLRLMEEVGILKKILPELALCVGVTQNKYHIYDVWEHTLKVLENITLKDCSSVENGFFVSHEHLYYLLRFAALFHDIGKPESKFIDENGNARFFHHQNIGIDITIDILNRLKFSNADTNDILTLVKEHMRLGMYNSTWGNPSIRRLIRDLGKYLEPLFILTKADILASNPEYHTLDGLAELKTRIEQNNVNTLRYSDLSPLNGKEIMEILNARGKIVGKAKRYLERCIIEEKLEFDDKNTAKKLLLEEFKL